MGNIGHSTPWPDYDPCVVLGCNESVDNCTFQTGTTNSAGYPSSATISMVHSRKWCTGTLVNLGDKDGKNGGTITDLLSCIAAVQAKVNAASPTCSEFFFQDFQTKDCKCVAPGNPAVCREE